MTSWEMRILGNIARWIIQRAEGLQFGNYRYRKI